MKRSARCWAAGDGDEDRPGDILGLKCRVSSRPGEVLSTMEGSKGLAPADHGGEGLGRSGGYLNGLLGVDTDSSEVEVRLEPEPDVRVRGVRRPTVGRVSCAMCFSLDTDCGESVRDLGRGASHTSSGGTCRSSRFRLPGWT